MSTGIAAFTDKAFLLPYLNKAISKEFDPSQARDESGRWTADGGASSTKPSGNRGYSPRKQTALPNGKWADANNAKDPQEALKESYAKFGYNAKPEVSTSLFEQLKDEGATLVYRGVSRDEADGKSPEEMANEFKNGDENFAGYGYYGNGVYTTTSEDTAKDYAMRWDDTLNPGSGLVMPMAIRPEANFIEYDEIGVKLNELSQGKPDEWYESPEFEWLDKDPSNVAIHLGYDGIVREDKEGENHYVILNRSAVVMPE